MKILVNVAHFSEIQPARVRAEVRNSHGDVSERDRFNWVYTANCKFFSVFFIVSQMSSLHNAAEG